METLTSWPDAASDSVRYYSGKGAYTREFSLNESLLSDDREVYVRFDDVQEMARVYVNGKDCGIVWAPPYQTNIGEYIMPGRNEIRVEVINTWNNRIVGDLKASGGKVYTKTNARYRFRNDSPLLPSGLIGNAEILFIEKK